MTHDEVIAFAKELIEHLEYIGWGDRWEREGAIELRKQAEQFNEEYSE